MQSIAAEFLRYVEALTGTDPRVSPVGDDRSASLPLYLRSHYEIVASKLFGRRILLAIQKPKTAESTPTEYARHHDKLKSALAEEVALVLPRVSSYGRQQLIRFGVPFVVPHRQMFLPHIAVDLRERFPRVGRRDAKSLSAAAQVVLLRYLLHKPTSGVSLRELSGQLGYSAMTMSNVRGELEDLGLCQTVRKGRSMHLVFPVPMREYWEHAEPYLQSPVKTSHWIRWSQKPTHVIKAGLTALESLSMVSDDAIPTCAMKTSDYRARLDKGVIVGCAGPELAEARLECWRYDPALLTEGPTVDRLSLYLSLRRTEDERVDKALKIILTEMPW